MRPPPLLFIAAVAAFGVSGSSPVDLQVTAVRFWSLGQVTRIAIETNGDFDFKRDRLEKPDRLFFDIIDARPNLRGAKVSNPVKDKYLKQIRIAENTRGRTRVVFDLKRPVDYTVSKLENPDRLIIELRAMGPHPSPPVISVAPNPVGPPAAPNVTPSQNTFSPVISTLAKPSTLDTFDLPEPDVPQTQIPQPPVVAPTHQESPIVKALPAPVSAAPVTAPFVGPSLAPSASTSASARPTLESASPAKKSTLDGSRSLIRALGLKINRVVIDAGHGGRDAGTSGPTGLLEKDLVLDVSLRLGKLIEQRLGSEVIYTRHDDSFVALEERTAIANRSHADLFLSIHANASPLKAAGGVENYYLNFTSSPDSLDVAARENASSQKSIFELRDIIQSISLHDKIDESKEFANDLQRTMQAQAARHNPSVKDRGVKRAPFVVLIGAQMPSVLSEIGFISNPKEEALLKRADYRQQIAEALYKGLARYVDSLSHTQVASQISPGNTGRDVVSAPSIK